MLRTTGWSFQAQLEAGSPGSLAKEAAYICLPAQPAVAWLSTAVEDWL